MAQTTTKRKTTTISLVDDEISEQMAKAAAEAETKTVDIFGESFEITTDINQWLLTRMLGGDYSMVTELFESLLVRQADKPGLTAAQKQAAEVEDMMNIQRLNKVLGRQRGLTGEVLIALLARITGVVAERPTKSPSASSRTSVKAVG